MPWMTSFRRATDCRLHLYCFPYAGGSGVVYRVWPDRIPPGIEVRAVHVPGRGALFREPILRDLPALIRRLAHGLLPTLSRPAAFFGHSLGGLVAFEVAREMRRLADF